MKRLAAASIFMIFTVLVNAAMYSHAAESRPYTADRHKAYGVECKQCHADQDKNIFDYRSCLSCHESYQKVAERTRKRSRNPHKSHYGDLECNVCHHGHKADEDYCATCHSH